MKVVYQRLDKIERPYTPGICSSENRRCLRVKAEWVTSTVLINCWQKSYTRSRMTIKSGYVLKRKNGNSVKNIRLLTTGSCINKSSTPFYRYVGHIEFIRFKEYYGMPRGHSLSIFALFSGKKRSSMYISREKGIRYYIQRRHNDLFSHFNLFLEKLKNWPESERKSN